MISSIVIVSKNNVIGCENDLVFDIKEDLKRFKEITQNHTIIMGRKTFDSLPFVLPNRHHIILTNNKNYISPESKEKITVINDINEIISMYANSEEEVFLIGGGVIFELLMPYINKHYITHVDKEAIGDTFYPKMDYSQFTIVNKSDILYSQSEQCDYYYIDYVKTKM